MSFFSKPCVASPPSEAAAHMSFMNDDSTSISGHRLAPSGAGKLLWPTAWSPGQKSISIPLGFDRNTKCGPRRSFGERSYDCTAYVLDKTTPIIIRRCQFLGGASLIRPGGSLPTFMRPLEGLDLTLIIHEAGRTAGSLGGFIWLQSLVQNNYQQTGVETTALQRASSSSSKQVQQIVCD